MPEKQLATPAEYWDQTEARRFQALYVACCEVAAAAMDYAEGLSLLRREERRHGAARLNWAGTAFYYSLVHSARFLIFSATGDFPTKHNVVPKAFIGSHTPLKTDWLDRFASDPVRKYQAAIKREEIIEYWGSITDVPDIATTLELFGNALENARALRNENNYEALLIAHEYRHEYLDSSFKRLAEAMRAVAGSGIEIMVHLFSRSIELGQSTAVLSEQIAQTGASANIPEPTWDAQANRAGMHTLGTGCIRPGSVQAAFVRDFVEKRIIAPVWDWYGTDVHFVSNAVSELLGPLRQLHGAAELGIAEIEQAVDFGVFDPKRGLMDTFIGKIAALEQVPTLGLRSQSEE